jgi:hypothetical protein
LGPGGSRGNAANPLDEFLFKSLFSQTGCFNRKQTVQISGVCTGPKKERSIDHPAGFNAPERVYGPKITGVP